MDLKKNLNQKRYNVYDFKQKRKVKKSSSHKKKIGAAVEDTDLITKKNSALTMSKWCHLLRSLLVVLFLMIISLPSTTSIFLENNSTLALLQSHEEHIISNLSELATPIPTRRPCWHAVKSKWLSTTKWKRGVAKLTLYYFISRLLLNLIFRKEKEIAGIEAARQLVKTIPGAANVKVNVISYKNARRFRYRRTLGPGYYLITGVPSANVLYGGLKKDFFPLAEEIFHGMCRPLTAWQSLTVGQTIHPEAIGTDGFCRGQLLWLLDDRRQPARLPLDDLDRQKFFHTWLWLKHIVRLSKYQPYISSLVKHTMQILIVWKYPKWFPVSLPFLYLQESHLNFTSSIFRALFQQFSRTQTTLEKHISDKQKK